MSDEMAELKAEIARLEDELIGAELERDEVRTEVESFQVALGDDEYLHREIKCLHDFIADVRLGIRDLDEYEAICGTVYI